MRNSFNIGIFDSGVGGITILKEVLKFLPKENVIYFADSINAPYGDKDQKEIERLCFRIGNFLLENNCKAILIACNTATAAALVSLQKTLEIPVIGVIEPGARAALAASTRGMISVMATPFTVKSEAYRKTLKKISDHTQVTQIPCASLSLMIEKGWEDSREGTEMLKNFIKEIPSASDTVILGCTHYSIIKDEIQKLLPDKLIVDPADETVLELKKILESKNLLNPDLKSGSLNFFVSGDPIKFTSVAEKFLGFPIENIKHIQL